MDGLYPRSGQLQLDLKKGEAILPLLGRGDPILLAPTPRARRFKGVIRDGRPTLVIPGRASQAQVKEVLLNLEPWFLQSVQRVRREREVIPESSLLLLGREVPWIYSFSLSAGFAFKSDGLHVRSVTEEHGKQLALSWLYRQAEARIKASVKTWGCRAGFQNIPVRVVETASRWGSCAGGQRLAFCWRQIMAPPEVIEYLAVHEITHLTHPNHSPAYWSAVSDLYPDYKRWDSWLAQKGSILMHRYPKQRLADLKKLAPLQAVAIDKLEGFRLVFGPEDKV